MSGEGGGERGSSYLIDYVIRDNIAHNISVDMYRPKLSLQVDGQNEFINAVYVSVKYIVDFDVPSLSKFNTAISIQGL